MGCDIIIASIVPSPIVVPRAAGAAGAGAADADAADADAGGAGAAAADSADADAGGAGAARVGAAGAGAAPAYCSPASRVERADSTTPPDTPAMRSEERRVGKERRPRRWTQ